MVLWIKAAQVTKIVTEKITYCGGVNCHRIGTVRMGRAEIAGIIVTLEVLKKEDEVLKKGARTKVLKLLATTCIVFW